jgi:hypothetical protein
VLSGDDLATYRQLARRSPDAQDYQFARAAQARIARLFVPGGRSHGSQ